VAELTSHKDNLPAMVALVGNEVGQNMSDVERQVSPDVGPRRWQRAAAFTSKGQQAVDATAAAP